MGSDLLGAALLLHDTKAGTSLTLLSVPRWFQQEFSVYPWRRGAWGCCSWEGPSPAMAAVFPPSAQCQRSDSGISSQARGWWPLRCPGTYPSCRLGTSHQENSRNGWCDESMTRNGFGECHCVSKGTFESVTQITCRWQIVAFTWDSQRQRKSVCWTL